jgi:hypothetical protein
MAAGDLLLFRMGNEPLAPLGARPCQLGAGFAVVFFQKNNQTFALLSKLKHHSGTTFSDRPGDSEEVIVDATLLLGCFPYAKHDSMVAVLASNDLLFH